MRIRQSDLDHLVNRINNLTNSPMTYSTEHVDINGKRTFSTNVGHYHLDGAYGGWKLVRTANDAGAINEVTYGFCNKRELYDKMQALIYGLENCSHKENA